MTLYIPKWIFAAFVGAAPMLGLVFLILFSCTLLGLVQRCKISLSKSYANRRRNTNRDRLSVEQQNSGTTVAFNPTSNLIIVSPFDTIAMKDIDAESLSKRNDTSKFRPNRSLDHSPTESDYDNASSSIFNDNDYQQDRLSLIETSSQRKIFKATTTPDTIINI